MSSLPDWAKKALADGSATAGPVANLGADDGKSAAGLVAPSFEYHHDHLEFVVPCEVPSLANSRDWRVRNKVAQAHRKAVSKAFGQKLLYVAPYAGFLHAARRLNQPGILCCNLIRLGGRNLDDFANLPASLKYVEDGVCLMLGIDDSDDRWKCSSGQEPGGPTGVKIKLWKVREQP